MSREAAEGFNLVCTKLLSLCTDSMFAKPRCSLKKVLIVAVRSCGCGALIRGLENLGASRKGNGFILFACTKRTKSTPEVCEPLDSGDDSKLCRKQFCKVFRRLVPKPVLPTKRRRKGFESVRKDSYSADARPLIFEKEILYCKLTVASDIRKGLLHVSFVAVGSGCHGALRKSFFIG